nr:hypothetical protein [Tanacetum cinerariifolium]
MELYIMNRQHERIILEPVKNGPLIWPKIKENGVTKPRKYNELTPAEALQADCDVKTTNIILQGLPNEIYALVSHHKVAKDLWERIQLLIQGTSLTKQERECKLYDEFDKFTYKKGETLHDFYLRFSLLVNNLNIYNVNLEQFQVNTKFLNSLPPEWSKFVTDVKLVRDLHTTNIDQLYAYLEQHEFHANEVRLMHERNSDLLALSQHYSTNQPSTPLSLTYPSNNYQPLVNHNAYSSQTSIPQLEYVFTVNQKHPEFSPPDLGLNVLVFKHGDDPIDAINHMMSFLTSVVASRFPATNNQLRNSSNPRQEASINDGSVTLQLVQGRQTTFAVGTTRKYNPGTNGSNSGKQRTVICYNCKGEGHMSKQCSKPKRKRDDSRVKDKVLLAAVQNSNLSAQDALILSVIDQLKTQVVNYTKINLENKNINDTFTTELERYKEQVKVLKEGQIVEKAQQSEPNLYDGNVIKNNSAVVNSNSEETLMLAEESHPTSSIRPTKFEVPKELPKVSTVNTSLKKLKHHIAGFDVVIKEKTTSIVIIKGSWGFEHTKACFRDEIIPFVKAVEQHRLESKTFEIKMNQVLNENERLLEQVINKDIMNIVDNSVSNQIASIVDHYFELNELKAQLQEKDTVISKLKEKIKYLSGNKNTDNVKKDIEEIETINIVLDHRVSKLIAENEHLKHTYKQLYDLIKPTRIRSKEQCDTLINQVNQKSVEIYNLNVSLQEKYFVITALKDDLGELKGKALVDDVGISHETSVARSLQQNGVIERRSHTLIEAARTIVDHPALEFIAQIAEVVALEPAASTGSPSSTTVDQDAPSPSNSQTTLETQTPIISNDVAKDNHDLDVAHMHNDPFFGVKASPKTPTFCNDPLHESLHNDSTSQGSSSNMRQTHTLFESLGRWTKDHLIANMIGDPSRSVSTRKQLQTDAMWFFFDAFLTIVEPKNFKQAMTEPSWIDAMQEEIYEFERLEV